MTLTSDVGNTFMGDAAATVVSALGGGTGQTTYAENIGVLSITLDPIRASTFAAVLLNLAIVLVKKATAAGGGTS